MASFASLSREERLGLGVAAAAHVALVAALVWQVRDEPTALPIPERIEVSLADEVSLESTAPDPSADSQAAIAPMLAPEPQPAVEPQPVRDITRPAQRPTVTQRPTPRPTQRATPAPTPRPTATRAGGSRLGDDFLQGAGTSARGGTPAASFGPAEQASLEQAINRQLKPHWSAPSGVDAERLVTVLAWELNEDGSLKGPPRVVSQSGVTDSNRPQAPLHAERAIRAVQLAAPFDLPQEFYDKWKRIRTWRFDRRL